MLDTADSSEIQDTSESSPHFQREWTRNNCALGIFIYRGLGEMSYYETPRRLQETQGEHRGGGGYGLAMNSLTHDRVMSTLASAPDSHKKRYIHGQRKTVDFSSVRQLAVATIHAAGRDIDTIIRGFQDSHANPLYVEALDMDPGALSPRTYHDTFGDIDNGKVRQTYIRVFMDIPKDCTPSQIEQRFHKRCPGPVIMSLSHVSEHSAGVECIKITGGVQDFDNAFRKELSDRKATYFALHSRFPTRKSKPGVEDCQPCVVDLTSDPHNPNRVTSLHNGNIENADHIRDFLQAGTMNHYAKIFFNRYGTIGVPPKKIKFPHMPAVDSAIVAKLYCYLVDCCRRHGIDESIIPLLERPPALSLVSAMPPKEKEFFKLARLAFPELSYQGSMAIIVSTDRYTLIESDKTRVMWMANDVDGNWYVASNGGAIINACDPDRLIPETVRPVPGNEAIRIDHETGETVCLGSIFKVPGSANGSRSYSVFMPGQGFDLSQIHLVASANNHQKCEPVIVEKKSPDFLKLPPRISSEYGRRGFTNSDIDRLLHYANTGQPLSTGLGVSHPDGVLRRSTSMTDTTSTHQAHIVSPGRDPRIEEEHYVILRQKDGDPLVLTSPMLVSSVALQQSPEGKVLMRDIADRYGTMCIDSLPNQTTIKATYKPEETLADAMRRVSELAVSSARQGFENIILDDSVSENELPLPAPDICGAVSMALRKNTLLEDGVKENCRSRVNLIGNFRGIRHAEQVKDCILNDADAVATPLLFDTTLGAFDSILPDSHTRDQRNLLHQRGIHFLCGMDSDIASATGSCGYHDINAMRGNAVSMLFELGMDEDWRNMIGKLSGMNAGGIDLATLDCNLRSVWYQHDGDSMPARALTRYAHAWERWSKAVLSDISEMARQGRAYRFHPQFYRDLPPVTMEDLFDIEGFDLEKYVSDESLRTVNLTLLDFLAVMISPMSIGALNIETWIAIVSAIYELRHEAESIPFLNDDEKLMLANVGEGGIADELRMFMAHIVGQYSTGRFGVNKTTGDIFSRGPAMKDGLLRMKEVQEAIEKGEMKESEVSDIEFLIAKLVKSEYIVKDILALSDNEQNLLGRFICIVNLKSAQDAKRGLGGMMFKTIFFIAAIRGVTPHDALKSFFNHAEGDSIEEIRQRLISVLREAGGEIPEIESLLGCREVAVISKLALDPYFASNLFGSLKGGPTMHEIDWAGGTGNRPIGTDRARHSWIVEASRTFDALNNAMLGEMSMMLMSSNRNVYDALRSCIVGQLDGVMLGSSLLRALQCSRCGQCSTGPCPPLIADQRGPAREKLHHLDSDTVNAEMQKENVKRFILAFLRAFKEGLSRLGAKSVSDLKGRTDLLKVREGIEVEGAEHIRALLSRSDVPYKPEVIERACNVSARLRVEQCIQRNPFPEQATAVWMRQWLDFSRENVPNEVLAQNVFLLVGDIANAFPHLQQEHDTYFAFIDTALSELERTYEVFLDESRSERPASFSIDDLLQHHRALDHIADRDHLEFLERLITARRIQVLALKFQHDRNRHEYKDQFFAATVHGSDPSIAIKSPRAIVSEQNRFSIDRSRGVQRKIAQTIVDRLQDSDNEKNPLIITIEDVLTDKDMGILSCLNALYHHFKEVFDTKIERIELHLGHGISGHNLGALINGNLLFDGQGREKLQIFVQGHGDGGVGLCANGATLVLDGGGGDSCGAYASDLTLSGRHFAFKLGMGAKGNTLIYSHAPLPDVTGVGSTGNVMILTAGVTREGEGRRAPAKLGIGGDMQGLSCNVMHGNPEVIKAGRIFGKGTLVKRLSQIDCDKAQKAMNRFYPHYGSSDAVPAVTPDSFCKVVSEHYYRNLMTSFLVYDHFQMRDDYPYKDQLQSGAGELLELHHIYESHPHYDRLLSSVSEKISWLKEAYSAENGDVAWKADPDSAFLEARRMALDFLQNFRNNPQLSTSSS